MTEPVEGQKPHTDTCDAANGPCGQPDCWHNPMGDPMVDWLAANRVDLGRIAMFPEIDLRGGEMLIEYIYGLEGDGDRRGKLVLRHPATRMVRMPVLQPMPPELWEVYQRARADYRMGYVLDQLARGGATVLAARPGSHLVFVCSNPMSADDDFLRAAMDVLQEALPDVGIQIMTGVDTILHRAPQEG